MIHPALLYALGAAAMLVLPRRGRQVILVAVPTLVLATLGRLETVEVQWLGHALTPIFVDGLSTIFCSVFALMGLIGGIYGLGEQNRRTVAPAFAYVGAAFGVVLAGDLMTLFVAWELKAATSAIVILVGGQPGSLRAGLRYLALHTLGGGCLLAGIAMSGGGSDFIDLTAGPGAVYALFGVLIAAAAPPLHGWLVESYPKASIVGTVFLSAFTTKAAIYVLARLFPGTSVLIWVGVAMAVLGSAFAMIEDDLRRILSYSIIAQLGYMTVAIGIGSELAIDGAAAHAFAHILYKALLFMAAGAILHATGRVRLSELGGLGRRLPWLYGLYVIGALSIAGVPGTSGAVSKALILAAVEEQHLNLVAVVLLLASVASLIHTGLRVNGQVFLGPEPEGLEVRPIPAHMYLAMGGAAALCLGLGWSPFLERLLPFSSHSHALDPRHIVGSLSMIAAAALAWTFLADRLTARPGDNLDVDAAMFGLEGLLRDLSAKRLVPIGEKSQALIDQIGQKIASRALSATATEPRPMGFWLAIPILGLTLLALYLRG